MDYRGTVSRTESGATCETWGADWPGMEEVSYCRNPGHVGVRPWCFTNREENEWEYCNIEQCGRGTYSVKGSHFEKLQVTEDFVLSW